MKLSECLSAIKEHAFHASAFPVVITFEDHLPPNLQVKVAKVTTFNHVFETWNLLRKDTRRRRNTFAYFHEKVECIKLGIYYMCLLFFTVPF